MCFITRRNLSFLRAMLRCNFTDQSLVGNIQPNSSCSCYSPGRAAALLRCAEGCFWAEPSCILQPFGDPRDGSEVSISAPAGIRLPVWVKPATKMTMAGDALGTWSLAKQELGGLFPGRCSPTEWRAPAPPCPLYPSPCLQTAPVHPLQHQEGQAGGLMLCQGADVSHSDA